MWCIRPLAAHANTRLFISHGGLLGTQEAVYHGVPMLGLPFGHDQHANLAKAKIEGYALVIQWDQLNEEALYQSITSIINQPRYNS